MQFDLNGLVALEQRFGSVQKAVEAIRRKQRLTDIVWAFTRNLDPAPSEHDVGTFVRSTSAKLLWYRIKEGFVDEHNRATAVGRAALPLPLQGLRLTSADVAVLAAEFSDPPPLARYVRRALSLYRAGQVPGITESEAGRELRASLVTVLYVAVAEAIVRLGEAEVELR